MELLLAYFKNKTLALRTAAIAAVAIAALTVLSQTAFAKTSYVIDDGGRVFYHTSYASDPVDVLTEVGVDVDENDRIQTTRGADTDRITVIRGMEVTVVDRGVTRTLVSYGETLSELLNSNGIALNENSSVDLPLQTTTFDGMVAVVKDTVTSTDTYTEVIPYEVIYRETSALAEGTQVVLVQGQDGEQVCTAECTYVNGLEERRNVLSCQVVREPVAQVVAVGTGDGTATQKAPLIGDGVIVTGEGDVLTFTHRETFLATAYSRSCEGGQVTATGTVTRVGAIAVDPDVIPYGTRMFIVTKDGQYIYGVATAEDCGGSIQGHRVDLFYESKEYCLEFGMRYVDIYFLG